MIIVSTVQASIATLGVLNARSMQATCNSWVADAVALVPLLVMLVLRTGALRSFFHCDA